MAHTVIICVENAAGATCEAADSPAGVTIASPMVIIAKKTTSHMGLTLTSGGNSLNGIIMKRIEMP